jgi:hypothetical protein
MSESLIVALAAFVAACAPVAIALIRARTERARLLLDALRAFLRPDEGGEPTSKKGGPKRR